MLFICLMDKIQFFWVAATITMYFLMFNFQKHQKIYFVVFISYFLYLQIKLLYSIFV